MPKYFTLKALFFQIAAIPVLVVLLNSCVPVATQTGAGGVAGQVGGTGKLLRMEDYYYEPNIRTALLYPFGTAATAQMEFPIIPLGDRSGRLMLEFDEIGGQYQNYYYRIMACNADWTPSILTDMEILPDYNEHVINNYEISLNTRTTYVHYSDTIPMVKLSGNYVVMVYRNRNTADVVLTRRFMVVENLISVTPAIKFPIAPDMRYKGQQIDFTIGYPEYEVFNPAQMLKVVVRQNGRWDNAISNLKPLFIRDEDRTLDYSYLNGENVFAGTNEWRIFDIRSMRFLGTGMATTNFDNNGAYVTLNHDATRNQRNYTFVPDFDGRFAIQNYETQRGAVEADYITTTFTLNSPRPVNGNVYVFGGLSDYRLDRNYLMRYDSTKLQYTLTTRLKQGVYNYMYMVSTQTGPDLLTFEGTFSLTQNLYDFIVYYRPIGSRYDRIIAYNKTSYNGR